MNRRSKEADDSDEEDYRKGYLKARKDKPKVPLPPSDIESIDFIKFNQQFAKNLLQERGLEITDQEMGLKRMEVPKPQKPKNYVQPGFSNLVELQNALVKSQGNLPQTLTILKEILYLENLEDSVSNYYSAIRAEFLIKNRQHNDCKMLCEKSLSRNPNVMECVRLMISLSQAQCETDELWDAWMSLIRCQALLHELKEYDVSECTFFNVILEVLCSPYDISVEDVLRSLENQHLTLKVKGQKDKKTLTPLMIQGSSSTGALGMGEETTECPEMLPLSLLRGRQVLSLACGEHHIIALVSGCSCLNPFEPKFECKGAHACNDGCEVMGWGENFLGQAVGNRKLGNFITQPMVIRSLSKQRVVGVAAKRSTSLAWTADGQVFRWGISLEDGSDSEVLQDKTLSMKNIVQVVIGQSFFAILDMNRNVYLCGKMQLTRSTQALVNYRKPEKLNCKSIIQISAGDNHLIALDDEGSVFGMGSNEYGQLGMRPSNGMFQSSMKSLGHIEQSGFISANQNLSLAITLEGELLYMGEVTEMKQVDFPKSAQIPGDVALLQTQSYGGQIFALDSEGRVYKWDPDNEPRFKLFQQGPIREIQLGRGIRAFRNQVLRGSFCKVQLQMDEEGNEPTLTTFEDIHVEINLKDEFGDYGIKLVHPVRLHYVISKKQLVNKEIVEISQLNAFKQFKSKTECQVYPYKLMDADEGKLIKFEVAESRGLLNIKLQISEAGVYHVYCLLNEELVQSTPLRLTILKSDKEDEMAKKQSQQDEDKKRQEEEQRKKREEKAQKDEQNRRRLEEEQALQDQKKRETQARAEEALRIHNLRKQEEERKLEEERKQKKDLLTGGGFDLEKLKAQQLQRQQTGNIVNQGPDPQKNIVQLQPRQSTQQKQVQAQQPVPRTQQQPQKSFNIRATDTRQKQGSQSVQQRAIQQPPNKPPIRQQLPQLQRSAVQEQQLPQIPRRNVNSVQQTQRMAQTTSQFAQPGIQYQMSRTETKMATGPAIQNLMDPFQAQMAQMQSPQQSRNARRIKR